MGPLDCRTSIEAKPEAEIMHVEIFGLRDSDSLSRELHYDRVSCVGSKRP